MLQSIVSTPVLSATLVLLLLFTPAGAGCVGENGGTSAVTEIREGETLILADGRTIRLAGILTPRRVHANVPQEPRAEMERELSGLVLGKQVELHLAEQKRDRYGRLLAQVMVVNGSERVWVQERLTSGGFARVISSAANRLCIRDLLARENEARDNRRGFWSNGYFAVRSAEAESLLNGLTRNYEIVQGRVHGVVEIRGRTYINFGQDWRRDFTAVVLEKRARLFDETGSTGGETTTGLAKLKGQTIRVRGWLENHNGPSINVTHPEQIEVLGGQTAGPQ